MGAFQRPNEEFILARFSQRRPSSQPARVSVASGEMKSADRTPSGKQLETTPQLSGYQEKRSAATAAKRRPRSFTGPEKDFPSSPLPHKGHLRRVLVQQISRDAREECSDFHAEVCSRSDRDAEERRTPPSTYLGRVSLIGPGTEWQWWNPFVLHRHCPWICCRTEMRDGGIRHRRVGRSPVLFSFRGFGRI